MKLGILYAEKFYIQFYYLPLVFSILRGNGIFINIKAGFRSESYKFKVQDNLILLVICSKTGLKVFVTFLVLRSRL